MREDVDMHHDQLIAEIITRGVLQFGDFTLKSGRQSPYFFNLGAICDASGIQTIGTHCADTLADYPFDVLLGPAYKGISLACSTAIALWTNHQRDVCWSYNRKEVKDHGEGGQLVGAALSGKVVIVDDILTAGTAARQSIEMIHQQGAEAAALLVVLDRMELGQATQSAADELRSEGIEVLSVLNIEQIIDWLGRQDDEKYHQHMVAMQRYRQGLSVAV